jgi:hypothetical protein
MKLREFIEKCRALELSGYADAEVVFSGGIIRHLSKADVFESEDYYAESMFSAATPVKGVVYVDEVVING